MGLNQFYIHCDGSLRDSAMDENVTVEDEDQVQVEQGMGLHPGAYR